MAPTLLEQIAEATAEMRDKQKAYFGDRKQSLLIAAKEAEKKVDALIAEWKRTKERESGQLELFKV